MTTPPLSVNGHAIQTLVLNASEVGVWTAECQLTESPVLDGAVTLTVGTSELRGTVIESQSFGLALGLRIAGGGGGWSKLVSAKGYHNDAGIKTRLIAEDAAREAGETLDVFSPDAERVGVDYVRHVSTASSVLQYAAGGVPWWVAYDGLTRVAPRPALAVPANAYSMLAYDPRAQVALLAVDDFSAIVPGAVITDSRMTTPLTIRDVELTSLNGAPLRATVWCGGAIEPSRLGGLFRTIVSRLTEGALWGVYRYRVIATRGDLRVDLQAVRQASGLPDLQAVPQCPGVPGLAANLTDGAEVLVQFVDGDPRAPLITHYAGPGSTGFAPVGIIIGGDEGAPAARQGDSVRVLIPPAQFAGTLNGVPMSGVVSWLAPNADGTITGGSGKVRVA